MMRVIVVGLVAVLLLGCEQQQQQQAPQNQSRQAANSDRYDRDRESCRSVVDDHMRTRRNIDDSRREVYSGSYERYGQTTLPAQMANYGDSRSADKLIANCMESRGWPQPSKAWWQKIGS
jgi:hypothetical protein